MAFQANATSGMAVDDECKLKFLELKAKRSFRFIIFRIDGQQVVVEKLGKAEESYDDFTASLPANECRYAVYDFDFTTEENCQKSKIFFIAWYSYSYSYSFLPSPLLSSPLHHHSSIECTNLKLVLVYWTIYVRSFHFILSIVLGDMMVCNVVCCRSPDSSKVRMKMVYASSKDRFKRELDGIQVELQATDPSEMSFDIIKARAL